MLFLHYPENAGVYVSVNEPDRIGKVFTFKGEKVIYNYNRNSGQVSSARQNKLLKPKINIVASNYAVQYPSRIQIRLKKKMEINLYLIEE